MVRIGDKVKIDINVLEEDFNSILILSYIHEHPDEVYTVKGFDEESLAQVVLDHPLLSATSFFPEELILIGEEN